MKKVYCRRNMINVRLVKFEVDIILQALADYINEINAKSNFRRKPLSADESLEKYFAKSIYEHILNEKTRIVKLKKSIKK